MRYFLWAAVVVGAVASLGVRFAHERMPSATFWQDHAGVLMTCIILTAVVPGLQARFVMHDLREAFSPFYEADRAAWAALSSEVRFGLSFDEFQRTRDLYGVVAAVAILDPKTPGKTPGASPWIPPEIRRRASTGRGSRRILAPWPSRSAS